MKAFSFNQAISDHPQPNVVLSRMQFMLKQYSARKLVQQYSEQAQQILDLVEQANENELTGKDALEKWLHLAMLNQLIDQKDELNRALAGIVIYAQRSLGMKPYLVQLVSALAMLDGHLVQLAPGEGKTLTIAIVSAVFAWSGKPCHVITANDYLAQRDAETMQPLYLALRVEATSVDGETPPEEKAARYAKPIVYATAKQLLADYLKDYLEFGSEVSRVGLSLRALKNQNSELMMRGLYVAIVDEADSILVDDATTPLIISAPQKNELLVQAVSIAKEIVDTLEEDVDYVLNKLQKDVEYSESGEEKILAQMERLPKMWHSFDRLEELLFQAILARDVFKLDQHYVIVDGEVIIVDESTGRMMPGRTWSYGLHQAIEARAGVELTDPSKTMARMSFQYFFKSYHKLCGASGTLQGIGFELFFNYQTLTLNVPTRLPSQLDVQAYHPYPTREDKWQALVDKIETLHLQGRSLLIGTRCIEDSETLAERLDERNLDYRLLNAKNHREEADIVARAGEIGKITVATNMAGRGTDIKVTDKSLDMGGLVVLMVEPHESARVDWQLFGRAGRQGQKGEAVAFVSLEDKLIKEHLPWWWRWGKHYEVISRSQKLTNQMVKSAQARAENKAFKRRKTVVKFVEDNRDRLSFTRAGG